MSAAVIICSDTLINNTVVYRVCQGVLGNNIGESS